MSDTLDLVDGAYEADTEWRGMIRHDRGALVAASFPVKPPSSWFADPALSDLTPLTILSSGQVFGHIAAWHTSHIGLAGGVRPPRSKSNYAFYRTGVVEADNGEMIDVGQITLAGGHASLDHSTREAVAHYDDTNSAIMDVAAGEDRHGIWVAGALRPSVTDEQVRSIRASSVSGDWRPINGKLELVAVCAVNCPGFPIPRARVAAGAPIALVAAGVEPLIEQSIRDHVNLDIEDGIRKGLSSFRERLLIVENAILADGTGSVDRAEQLRSRVHGTVFAEDDVVDSDRLAELRARVHAGAGDGLGGEAIALVESDGEGDGEVADASVEDDAWDDGLDIAIPVAAALRARVHR